jgi:ribosomal protein L13E
MSRLSISEARKKDTREKIALGGLVLKAGLQAEQQELLLGLLVDGRRRVEHDEAERARLVALGAEALDHGRH